jgi:hypothetical protein
VEAEPRKGVDDAEFERHVGVLAEVGELVTELDLLRQPSIVIESAKRGDD